MSLKAPSAGLGLSANSGSGTDRWQEEEDRWWEDVLQLRPLQAARTNVSHGSDDSFVPHTQFEAVKKH